MDRGNLLLIALAMLFVAGLVLGVGGILLFKRDRRTGSSAGSSAGSSQDEGPDEVSS